MTTKVRPDAPEVTNDEAIELAVYHLRMAQAYFEATQDDQNAAITEEFDRQIPDQTLPGWQSGRAWLTAIWGEYDKLKREMNEAKS